MISDPLFWVVIVLAIAAGMGLSRLLLARAHQQARRRVRQMMEEARQEATAIRREGELAVREGQVKIRESFEAEKQEVLKEHRETDRRLERRQEQLEDRARNLERREEDIERRLGDIERRRGDVDDRIREVEQIARDSEKRLEELAGLSRDEAKRQLLDKLESDLGSDAERLIEKHQARIKEETERFAQKAIGIAIQRCAVQYTSDTVVSTVDIPSDEMKGRIIGREGRNIRAFEKATGVDVIVDDTPGVVVVSCFDNVRREVARRALELLVQDGRIQPARIEEVVSGVREELEQEIAEEGRKTCYDLDLPEVHPRIQKLVGRLKYRTSYGQNQLFHAIEVAYIASALAAELHLDTQLAKRCGLLHDIGKSLDHEMEGGHPAIGAEVARRSNEPSEVVNAIAAHHEDVPYESIYAVLAQTADAISAARPGARRETIERYIKRLNRLEDLARAYQGVDNAYAVQAGREIRVIVDAGKVDDGLASKIAREIATQIEQELTYPGEIKVTLMRESRVVEYAK
ncbi:MAG: ribonuclease Y [Planctomycetota bacterium]